MIIVKITYIHALGVFALHSAHDERSVVDKLVVAELFAGPVAGARADWLGRLDRPPLAQHQGRVVFGYRRRWGLGWKISKISDLLPAHYYVYRRMTINET